MNETLFADGKELARIPMPDADVVLRRSIDLGLPADEVLARLVSEIAWREETITLWGKTMLQPRLVAWHGDPDASYVYSGRRFDPQPWNELLSRLRAVVEAVAGAQFNSVLLNYYRDGRDSVAMHSDDETELGREPLIASLSLGETRTLVFRHKTNKAIKTWHLPLTSGSLLVMKGPTQRCWQHAVPKMTAPCGPRVNLTFRQVGS